MRLRKVKYADELIKENQDIIIFSPENLKGKWKTIFKNDNPIEIEIGCGKGKFITELAKKNPDINYIGIEKFNSVIVRALEKLISNPLKNVKLIRIDAENITNIFSKQEINNIYLNFSDPWPKNRHAKKRLTSLKFLKRYESVLSQDGYIIMKTDNFKLFEFSMMSFNSNVKFNIKKINLDLYRNLPDDNVQTEFEKKFSEKGNSIFYQKVKFIGE